MTDLVPLATAQANLAAGLPADSTALQACLTAASRAVRKWCARDFTLTTYDETYAAGGYDSILLRQYPVNSVARLATNPVPALTVGNADSVTNQRATAALTTTGDVDSGLVVTGLTLNRVASGVATPNTLLFATYVTIQALANAVAALGNGWTATVLAGYGLWPTADLRAPQGAQAALGTGGGGALFSLFSQDTNAWTLNERTGEIRFDRAGRNPTFGLTFPPGFQNVRAVYTAGYATVPADVQQACLMTTRAMLADLQRDPAFETETAKDWSATLAAGDRSGLTLAAQKILWPWRAFRRS